MEGETMNGHTHMAQCQQNGDTANSVSDIVITLMSMASTHTIRGIKPF